MYIVTYPSSSEFSGGHPAVKMVNNVEELNKFLLGHHGDLSRVRIFEATELGLKLVMEKKHDTKD